MISATTYSMTPIKDILRCYNDLTNRGFSSKSLNMTLMYLSKALKGRGNLPRVMNDYTLTDLDNSWRMKKVVDDMKFGL